MAGNDVVIGVTSKTDSYVKGMEKALKKTEQVGKSAKSIKSELMGSVPVLGQMASAAGPLSAALVAIGSAIALFKKDLEDSKNSVKTMGRDLPAIIAGAGLSSASGEIDEAFRAEVSRTGSTTTMADLNTGFSSFVTSATTSTPQQSIAAIRTVGKIERAGLPVDVILRGAGAAVHAANVEGVDIDVERAAELAGKIYQDTGGGSNGEQALDIYRAALNVLGSGYAEEVAALAIAAAKGGRGGRSLRFLQSSIGRYVAAGKPGSLTEFVRREALAADATAQFGAEGIVRNLSAAVSSVAGSAGLFERERSALSVLPSYNQDIRLQQLEALDNSRALSPGRADAAVTGAEGASVLRNTASDYFADALNDPAGAFLRNVNVIPSVITFLSRISDNTERVNPSADGRGD